MKIVSCKTNHITNPIGFDLGLPTLSWKVEGAVGKKQKAVRITVATDPEMKSTVHDSGVKPDISSLAYQIPIKLKAYSRYYWKVSVWSDADECASSDINWFETAKLDKDWDAKWITSKGLKTENPVFTKTIHLDNDISDARVYICGLGLYECRINKKRVGNEYLAPGCTDYNMRIQYQTYEADLKKGENTIEVSLGNGWYKGRFGIGGISSVYGENFHLIMEIRKNGKLIAKTDGSWSVFGGNILSNGIYDGEVYAPGEKTYLGSAFEEENRDKSKLSARLSLPVKVKSELKVKEVIHTPNGETVLDMGQNFAGFMRFTVNEPANVNIRLLHGEVLQDGNFYNENLRTAKAEYVYISDGIKRTVEPKFTYFGFRYVKVEGLTKEINPDDFIGCVLYSDLDQTGEIKTDNNKINQLISNIMWGQKGNYMDIPTDCPQRDERLGWTADAQVFSGTACFQMDSYAFLNKFMTDVYDTQRELGCVTNIIPAFDDDAPTSFGWGDAATIVPWNLYQFYGDKEILRRQFKSMTLWADYIYEIDVNSGGCGLWKTEKGFGDWLALDNDNPNERFAGGTELTFLASAYYYYSTLLVGKAAAVLGYKEQEEVYFKRAAEIKKAFQNEYFTATGRLAVTTQTAYIIVLFMGLTPDAYVKKTAEALALKIKNCGGYLKTGFLGTPLILRVLSDHGYSDTAYKLLFNEDVPSWLYAVNLSATTVWERWNSMLPDGLVNGTDMNSFNHYSYGSVAEWMYRHMAGIHPVEECPGFQRVIIRPEVNARLNEVKAVYDSASGKYISHWKISNDGSIFLEITVPFNASALLILPRVEDKKIELDAGTYQFSYVPEKDILKKVNTYSSFNALKEYPPAAKILDKYMPDWRDIPSMFCEDSLRNMSKTPFINISDEDMDAIDRALE